VRCHNIVDSVPGLDYPAAMNANTLLDARGLLCPLPVLKLRKRLRALPPGATVELWADDPAAVVDVRHFCAESGHDFVGMTEMEDCNAFTVRKAPD